MPLFVLILLVPAAVTAFAKACGAIPSAKAAALWIILSGFVPAATFVAIMLASGRQQVISSPIVVIVGIAVAWLGFAAWPARWRRKG